MNEEIPEKTVVETKKENIGIGEDKPQLGAAMVTIVNFRLDEIKTKSKEGKAERITLIVDHPEVKDRPIEITGVRYEKGDKILSSGLWWKLDSEGKIPFRSALAYALRAIGAKTLKEMIGKTVKTVLDDNDYLVIKAY